MATSDPKRAAAIQPGTYVLLKGMPAQEAFDTLADPANRDVNRTTVREGLWASETYGVLSKQTGIPVKEYVKAAKDPEAIGLPKEADGKVEGWLFPWSAVRREVDRHAAAQGDGRPDRQDARRRRRRREGPPEGAHPGLAGRGRGKLDVDRPKIARVFLNRVETDGAPAYGLLQSDAAVSYAPSAARSSRARPSSTTRQPLQHPHPPGPAARPDQQPGRGLDRRGGQPGRRAVVFFVAVNPITGETKYGTTLAEHEANVAQLNAYCKAKPQDCGQ